MYSKFTVCFFLSLWIFELALTFLNVFLLRVWTKEDWQYEQRTRAIFFIYIWGEILKSLKRKCMCPCVLSFFYFLLYFCERNKETLSISLNSHNFVLPLIFLQDKQTKLTTYASLSFWGTDTTKYKLPLFRMPTTSYLTNNAFYSLFSFF